MREEYESMSNKAFSVVLTVLAVISVAAATQCVAQDSPRSALRVNGASFSSEEVKAWADQLMKERPDFKVVVTGSSAGKGFQLLTEGMIDVAIASRSMSEEEREKAVARGLDPVEKVVGYSAMVIITSPRNPVDELSLDQLKKIFTGKYTNWSQVGGPDAPIKPCMRRVPMSGGAVWFQRRALDKEPYSPNTVMTDNWGTIVKIVSEGQDIAIGGVPFMQARTGAKVLGVKKDDTSPAVLPSEASSKDESYPLILPFSLYWDKNSKDERIKPFVEYCQAKGGGK
jgi:phosphate transport system substrate-binding protein